MTEQDKNDLHQPGQTILAQRQLVIGEIVQCEYGDFVQCGIVIFECISSWQIVKNTKLCPNMVKIARLRPFLYLIRLKMVRSTEICQLLTRSILDLYLFPGKPNVGEIRRQRMLAPVE